LDSRDIEIINEGLKDNHNILGIHMLGNMGKTDHLGFLRAEQDYDYAMTTLFTRIKPNLDRGYKCNSQAIQLQASSNWWIWEGWTEVKFEFDPSLEFDEEHDPYVPIYLHLSCDGFEEDLLLPDEEKEGIYSSTRMVPPGDVSYYFTKESLEYLASNQPVGELHRTTEKFLEIPSTNILQNIIISNTPITKTLLQSMKWIPRPPPKSLGQRNRLKTPWDFFKSVFKDYKPDTQSLLNSCFEFDWEMCKIPRIIKNPEELEDTKAYLKKNYKHLREMYKYYSAISPVGLVFSIGNNVFSDIISNFDSLIDNQTLKLSDIDLEFVSTNAGPKKSNPRNPERNLVRFQIMEIFTRIALTKYFKTKEVKSQLEAIRKLFSEHLLPFWRLFDCHKWRKERLWNEKWDHVFKRYLTAVKSIYSKFSGKYAMPSAPKFMSFDEFFDLICTAGAVDETFGQREIGIWFNLAMMTQKDEIDKDRHLNMVLVEFIEAIGRVADKLSLPPFFEHMDGVPEEFQSNIGDMTISTRKTKYSILPLHIKIETLIMMMIQATHKKDYADKIAKKMEKFHFTQSVAIKKTKFVAVEQPYQNQNKPPPDVKIDLMNNEEIEID
jgi:NLR family CARD domain-containing protein 3